MLLAGIVAVNVLVLELNIQLDGLGRERAELKAETRGSARSCRARPPTCGSRRLPPRARPRGGRPVDDDVRPARRRSERPAREPPDSPPPRRLRLLFVVAVARAAWVQGAQHDRYSKMAITQHRETIEVPAGRGTIYDRTGEPLAIGEQATTVYADPRNIGDAQRAAFVAGRTLGVDAGTLYPSLKDRSKGRLRRAQGRPGKAAALSKRGIPGLGFYPEELRAYPQGAVPRTCWASPAPTTTASTGSSARSTRRCPAGPGSRRSSRIRSAARSTSSPREPERPGRNVTLTIDHQIQANAEQVLARTVRQFGARGGAAIVMDPRTGAILAMANYPTFDANRFATASPDSRRNRAVTDAYEPGSTFKIVTIAGALEDNVVSPTSTFTLPPTIQVADRVIHEAHIRGTEVMSVKEILAQSSNIGTITIAEKLGGGELVALDRPLRIRQADGRRLSRARARASCFRSRTGRARRSAPSRSARASPSRRCRWSPPTRRSATAACGVTPHLVEKVGSGRVARPHEGRRVVSKHTADRMMAMFRDVVARGHRHEAAIPGYTVAGKTGTAQKAENGRYVTKYVASFVGLVPAKQPAPRDPRDGRRAARQHLRRRRRRAGVPRHRPVRPPVPRGAARRARDEGVADGRRRPSTSSAGEPVRAVDSPSRRRMSAPWTSTT